MYYDIDVNSILTYSLIKPKVIDFSWLKLFDTFIILILINRKNDLISFITNNK